jgi:uncharacterized protein (TIGR01244 family)
MMRVTTISAVAVLLTTMSAFAQTPIHDPVKLQRTDFQAAIADVGPAFVAGQPTADALRSMKAAGVTTVINLRTQPEMDDRQQVPFDEEALVKELGMTYVHIPLGRADTPYTPAAVAAVDAAMKAAPGKVLLHCTIAWRASHMWAAYLATFKGYTQEQAKKAGEAINMNGFNAPGRPAPFDQLMGQAPK